ncbi:MAG: glycosyltransferase family 4 protein [Acidobacteriota bacterium]
MKDRTLRRIGVIGPLVGRHQGYATSQGLILSRLFAAEGYRVIVASSRLNRYARLADIAWTLLREGRYADAVILEVYGGPSFVVESVAAAICRLHRLPVIMVLHGGNMPRFVARFPRWARWVMGCASALVSPSRYLREQLGSTGYPIRIIPNVINLADYPHRIRAQVTPRLLWMRAFHEVYDPTLAIRILAGLKVSHPEATLTMAGPDKGLLENTRAYARSMGVGDSVRFVGFLDPEGKRRAFDEAEVFLNTSTIDNMPVAFLEAWAAGLPLVTTDVGGIPYLVRDGETGLLYPRGDADEAVRALRRLLGDPDLARRLSLRGRAEAERCDWSQVRPQWERLFGEVLKPYTEEGRS